MLLEEARALSFRDKALRTLDNIEVLQCLDREIVQVPFELRSPEFEYTVIGNCDRNDGLAYACSDYEALQVYQWLIQTGAITLAENVRGQRVSGLWIQPRGLELLEEYRTGVGRLGRRGFLVRRWNPERDAYLDAATSHVQAVLDCTIVPVWAEHHNEKIDDRILQEIKRSTIVVVDVDRENFNVGFEAGYALALRKPIVWIRHVETGQEPRPFDIITYNCLDYTDDGLEAFKEALVFRVQAALDAASS